MSSDNVDMSTITAPPWPTIHYKPWVLKLAFEKSCYIALAALVAYQTTTEQPSNWTLPQAGAFALVSTMVIWLGWFMMHNADLPGFVSYLGFALGAAGLGVCLGGLVSRYANGSAAMILLLTIIPTMGTALFLVVIPIRWMRYAAPPSYFLFVVGGGVWLPGVLGSYYGLFHYRPLTDPEAWWFGLYCLFVVHALVSNVHRKVRIARLIGQLLE